MRSRSESATLLPLAICAMAVVVGLLIVGTVLLGVVHPPGSSMAAPAWSGSQPPPGAVGFSPERTVGGGLSAASAQDSAQR